MKKLNLISFIVMILAIIGLALLKCTGIVAHIIISVVALAVMVACVILGKKDWKVPALEILYRAFYLIALITGIVMQAADITGAVSIVHKIAAGLFAVLVIVNFIVSAVKKK